MAACRVMSYRGQHGYFCSGLVPKLQWSPTDWFTCVAVMLQVAPSAGRVIKQLDGVVFLLGVAARWAELQLLTALDTRYQQSSVVSLGSVGVYSRTGMCCSVAGLA